MRETSKRKQSFRTRRGICFIGKEHSADPALHSSRRKKYGMNTKTERQPWKNPRSVFCISVAFFSVFPCISERCCYNKGKWINIHYMRREGDYYENEFCKKSNSTCNVRFVCCFDGRLRKFCIYRKESISNIRRGSGRSEDWCTDRNNRWFSGERCR